jgi:predicted PurR-regulated permease PerM
MGRTLDIHPLVVLVVTALGGLLCGIGASSWPCLPP